jgi:hypothetical protein
MAAGMSLAAATKKKAVVNELTIVLIKLPIFALILDRSSFGPRDPSSTTAP